MFKWHIVLVNASFAVMLARGLVETLTFETRFIIGFNVSLNCQQSNCTLETQMIYTLLYWFCLPEPRRLCRCFSLDCRCQHSWKSRKYLGDPKLLNNSVSSSIVLVLSFTIEKCGINLQQSLQPNLHFKFFSQLLNGEQKCNI